MRPCTRSHLQPYVQAVTIPAMAYDPNYTPDDDEFERAAANAIVGKGAIILGSLCVAAVCAVAVAHYGYDVPIYYVESRGSFGTPSSPSGVIFILLALGVAGTLTLCAGLYIRRKP